MLCCLRMVLIVLNPPASWCHCIKRLVSMANRDDEWFADKWPADVMQLCGYGVLLISALDTAATTDRSQHCDQNFSLHTILLFICCVYVFHQNMLTSIAWDLLQQCAGHFQSVHAPDSQREGTPGVSQTIGQPAAVTNTSQQHSRGCSGQQAAAIGAGRWGVVCGTAAPSGFNGLVHGSMPCSMYCTVVAIPPLCLRASCQAV